MEELAVQPMQLSPCEVYVEVIDEGHVGVTTGTSTHGNVPVFAEDRFVPKSLQYMAFRQPFESSAES